VGSKFKTHEKFTEEVYDLVGNEYMVVGYYVSSKEKIIMRHNVCNREYPVNPTNFLSHNRRCPLCNNDNKKILYKGNNNPNYRKGTSGLHSYLRYYIDEWKSNIFKKYDYKCFLTNKNNGNLQIHHFYNYSNIISDVLEELQLEAKIDVGLYTEIELERIKSLFVSKHVDIKGVCLSKPIHDLFHHLYGRKNNSEVQFNEFRQRFINDELKFELENMKIPKKLKKKEVIEIRKMLINNHKVLDIADKFKVSPSTISNIKNNKTYKNVII